MRWLKSYSKYQESIVIDIKFQSIDLSESFNIDWHDILLKSISAEEIGDMFDELNMNKDDYKDQSRLDLDFLCGDGDRKQPYSKFIDSLSSKSLRISEVQKSNDLETFINKPCKFMFIYKQNLHDLQDPDYMMFQVWHDSDKTWTPVKLYKIAKDVKIQGKIVNDFFTKLSSKTIKISDDGVDYIYSTSNANDWVLQNSEKETDVYKKVLRKEELEDLIDTIKKDTDNKSIKLTIV
jgi:hypothetical protein